MKIYYKDQKASRFIEMEKVFSDCVPPEKQVQWIQAYTSYHLADWSDEFTHKEIRQLAIESWFRLVMAE